MPIIDMTATGENIRTLMENAGLTIKDVQLRLGFSAPQAVYNWTYGKSLPSIDNLVGLASVLGVTMDDIIVTSKE